jgi:hypothetical protein
MQNHDEQIRRRVYPSAALSASWAIVEPPRALLNLLLCDCDDVDGDAIELCKVLLTMPLNDFEVQKLTPNDLSRSLVSWSTSNCPLSLFWVKSKAEISGTY